MAIEVMCVHGVRCGWLEEVEDMDLTSLDIGSTIRKVGTIEDIFDQSADSIYFRTSKSEYVLTRS